MILTRKHLLVDNFLTRSLSKSHAFCKFVSINFDPWAQVIKALNGLDSSLFCHDTGAIYDWLIFFGLFIHFFQKRKCLFKTKKSLRLLKVQLFKFTSHRPSKDSLDCNLEQGNSRVFKLQRLRIQNY